MKASPGTPQIRSAVFNDRKFSVKDKDTRSYSNSNLLKRLNTNNFEDLCRAKKHPHHDQEDSHVSSTVEEKYEELSDKVKELYLEIRKECLSEEVQKKLASMPDLLHEGPMNYIEYTRSMMKMMSKTLKDQSQIGLGRKTDNPIEDYELVLQKAECDIKRHIRNEQQLQHLVDSMQTRLDEYDRDKDNFVTNAKGLLRDAKNDNSKLIDIIRKRDADIDNANVKARMKEETAKSYEERLLTIPILEHKIKVLKDSHAKEKEQIRQHYKQEFTNLTKEVQQIHKILSMNITIDEKIKVFERELHTYKNFNSKRIQSIEDKLRHYDDPDASHMIMVTDNLEAGGHESYATLPNKGNNKIRKSKPIEMTRSIEEKAFRVKQQVMKKRVELTNEINMLSIARVRDLNQELNSKRDEAQHLKSTKNFDNYFHHFAEKLTQLNQLNEKEKETLKSIRGDLTDSSKKNSVCQSFFGAGQPMSRNFNDDEFLPVPGKSLTPSHGRRPSKATFTAKASNFQPKIQIVSVA